jgi:hypothetical protein
VIRSHWANPAPRHPTSAGGNIPAAQTCATLVLATVVTLHPAFGDGLLFGTSSLRGRRQEGDDDRLAMPATRDRKFADSPQGGVRCELVSKGTTIPPAYPTDREEAAQRPAPSRQQRRDI